MIKKILTVMCALFVISIAKAQVKINDGKIIIINKDKTSDTIISTLENINDLKDNPNLVNYIKDLHKLVDSMEQVLVIINNSTDSFQALESEMTNFEDTPSYFSYEPKKIKPVIYSYDSKAGWVNLLETNKPNEIPHLNNFKTLNLGLNYGVGLNLYKGNIRLWTGLDYSISNFRFTDNNVLLRADTNAFVYSLDVSKNYSKSKVVVNYLGIPLAIGYQQNKEDDESGFWVKAGVIGAYRVRTHSKMKTSSGEKNKSFRSFGFSNFAVSPFVEIGYNSIGFYVKYHVLPMFEGNSPKNRLIQFGFVLK